MKFSAKQKARQELFDNTGDLFAIDGDALSTRAALTARKLCPDSSAPRLEDDIHPSISDFVVRSRHSKVVQAHSVIDSLDIDDSEAGGLTFISFGSGSSGNCAYLGTRDGGILIDAGVNADTVRDEMRRHGLSLKDVKGIVITHDHTDHVKYVYPLVKKRTDIAVFCTPKTLSGLLRRHSISRRIKDYHRPIYKEFAFKAGPFEITPFEVSHDGTDNVGYFITAGGVAMAVATDLGCITPRVEHYMRLANHIMIESNYDAVMLVNGPYPMHLKARIAADNGHLDNEVTGRFLGEIFSDRLRNVFLCHLSKDNNLPSLALETVRRALAQAGVTSIGDGSGSIEARSQQLQLYPLPRLESSLLFTLR